MPAATHNTFKFEGFTLDLMRGCLSTADREIALRPKSFEVLRYLVENAGRLVPKDEIMAAIWPHVTVTEEALTHCVSDVRRALADREQRTIKTVPRRGYLFAVPVSQGDAGSPLVLTTTAAAVDAAARSGASAGKNDPAVAFSAGFAAEQPVAPLSLPDKPSIAVLPFTNMSGDPEQEYFADGISEELITGLSHIRWLFVIARNSTFVYKGRVVDVKQVSHELGVRYVLQGSIRRAGRRLRVTAQLADAVAGCQHWAERYDCELGDIFALQDELTRSVAGAIEPRLLAAEGIRARSCSPNDLGAWELVIRALGVFWRLTRDDCESAIGDLTSAVGKYPEYAPAQSLLAYCLVFAAHIGWIDASGALPLGREHALRAAALDESDPWAHIALGYLAMMERRTDESIASCRRALALNPNSAAAHLHLGIVLAHAGHDRDAIANCESAIRLSPHDPQAAICHASIGVAHYLAGRFTSATESANIALQLRPGIQGFQRLLGASLAQSGRLVEARRLLAAIRREQPQLSIEWIRRNVPYQTPVLMERFLEGMRKAGLNGAGVT